ncbi:hypothetical protein LNQ81_09655 [Myroides sp. M-43]|uniref:hypothetical protein n=1 Tax=Myroides oncorhynchi TaxID=2893756 RepID=UPI001E45B159|nr:hypothetical protein [Myroides oncorhynchi]MCC9042939.1 hypothetical protein [Myroides oncorhynchi]
MIKNIFSLAILFSTPMFSQVVKDTIWVDSYDYIVPKKDAESFKIAKAIKGNNALKSIEVYKSNTNKLESKGNGKFQEGTGTVLYSGDVQYFNKEGKVNATYTYDENNMITKAVTIDPRNGEVYTCTYSEDNNLNNGIAFYDWQGVYVYVESEEGVYKSYKIINPKNDKNELIYEFDDNNVLIGEKYYNEQGQLTHQGTYNEGLIHNGESVSPNYKDFSVLSVSQYKEGVLTNTTSYYKNGKIKGTAVVNGNTTKEVYYDQNGKQLGTYTLKLEDDGYTTYQDGTNYYFNIYGDNTDELNAIYHYKDNVAHKVEVYHVAPEKNTVKSITYNKEDNTTQKIEYFNPDGTSKGQIIYAEDGYTPKEGTIYEGNTASTYKNSKLVERTEVYSNNKPFEITKNNVSVYYDTKGKELGRITFKEDPTYGSLTYITGTKYTIYNDLISDISKYEKENLVYQATYDNANGGSIISTESFYSNSFLAKDIEYYNNGKKAKIAIYNPNSYAYSASKETYFDNTGKELGTFDYVTQTGTKVEFSYDKQIVSIERFNEGKPLSKKGYTLKVESSTGAYFLQSDIDYNKQGKFYNEKGQIIATASYKDGAPYEGTVNIIDSYYNTETFYKKGLKVGKETTKYSSSDEIISINYYSNEGELTKMESYDNNILTTSAEYQNDVQHGTTTYYNADGEILSTLIFDQGYASEGILTAIGYDNYSTTEYTNGSIKERKFYTLNEDGRTPNILMMEEIYTDTSAFRRSIFDKETGAPIYKYGVANSNLDGLYQYFENNKVKYQSTFKEGNLIDGTVAINDLNYNPYDYYTEYSSGTSNHSIVTNKKGIYIVSIIDKDNKEIFKMEAKIKKGDPNLNPLANKKISIDNLFPANEYNVTDYYGQSYEYPVDAAADAVSAASAAAVEASASTYYE